MNILVIVLLCGFVGGIVRGLVAYIKRRNSYKEVPFKVRYFIFSVSVSGVVGLLAAWITKDLGIEFLGLPGVTPSLAIIIGYAGGDFIENLFKIITGKTSLYEFTTLQK
jgi:hypothetical protein